MVLGCPEGHSFARSPRKSLDSCGADALVCGRTLADLRISLKIRLPGEGPGAGQGSPHMIGLIF